MSLDYAAWLLSVGWVVEAETEAALVKEGFGRRVFGEEVCLTNAGYRAARQHGRLHYPEHTR